MKKLIIALVFSAPLLLVAEPGFSSAQSDLSNPVLRTDATSGYNNLPKTGANYAYYRHRGHWRWHRWHHRNYWHRPHRWRYW